jgi:phosphoglucosamine mutase
MGVAFCRSDVGDRYVLEAMLQRGWTVGGESSGHIICLDAHTTGDGIISSLRVLAAMVTFGETLFQQLQYMQKCPQVLINVPVATKINLQHETIRAAVAAAETQLGKSGRVLLRASGTEPLVRVMLEGSDAMQIKTLAQELADVVTECAKQQVGEISA